MTASSTPLPWLCRGHRFEIGPRPLVMGILNVTPDSFSDGGLFNDTARAVEHGLKLAAEGADIIDIGGESTRPGSEPVPVEEELRRVIPVVRDLALHSSVPISVDTSKAEVARQAIDAGAIIINDVTGLNGDPEMTAVARATGAGVIVMHMQGRPATMQLDPRYDDVVREVGEFFTERLSTLTASGIRREAIAVDPGIGFGKTVEHNYELLANLDRLDRGNRPLCLGVSRKGFIGIVCGRPNRQDRVAGSVALACFAVAASAAHILRVHDVAPTRDAVRMYEAIVPFRRK